MATQPQIIANRINAASSTGPQTIEGKTRSAANAVTLGLFTVRDFIRPGEEDQHALLCAALKEELHPIGLIEETLAAEVIHAAWRLQRCSHVEAGLSHQPLDPMEDFAADRIQNSVDRARDQSQRHLLRLIAELRRHQNGRKADDESLPENLSSSVDLARAQMVFRKLHGLADFESMIMAATAPPIRPKSEITKQTQSPEATPRNAACPCGSGVKYKRCCGQNAPAVLQNAA